MGDSRRGGGPHRSALRPGGRLGDLPALSDRGQATVEFALVLPLVAVLAIAILQIGIVVRDQLAVGLAAREGARAAAVAHDPTAAARAAVERTLPTSSADDPTVAVIVDAHTVTVQVRATVSVSLPLVGSLTRGREVMASTTMAFEPPD